MTFPQMLKVNPWWVVLPVSVGLIAILFWIEKSGF